MREILFRGKRKDNGEWVEGYLVIADERYFIANCPECITSLYYPDDIYSFTGFVEVIPETVGKYTGQTDKNGYKIFDFDIVDILTENEEIGVVTYDEGCSYVKSNGFSVDFRNNINGEDLLVIGNMHDNPELIKGGENNA